MIERAILTKKFVDFAQQPKSGKTWIADTKLKGFDLRLWSTKSGGNRALSIRVLDSNGKPIRKTFDAWDHPPSAVIAGFFDR
jgi:hypothetical protein